MKVLIYGYGWGGIGSFMSDILEDLDIDFDIYDDNFDIKIANNGKFLSEFPKDIYELVLVCIMDTQLANDVISSAKKIFKSAIIKQTICTTYKKDMKKFLLDRFANKKSFLEFWKEGDKIKFENLIKGINRRYEIEEDDKKKRELRKYIDDKYQDENIFTKIFHCATQSHTAYGNHYISMPGFTVLYYNNTLDKSLFFKDVIDINFLKNTTKKIILLFGASFLRNGLLKNTEHIDNYLGEILGDDYIIINASIHGYTLYEQITLYNAIFFDIRPHFVFSFFFVTDLTLAFENDFKFIKNHSIIYHSQWEENYKKSVNSNIPLNSEFKTFVPNNLTNDIFNKALIARLEQFYNAVSSRSTKEHKSNFIACITSVALSKKNLTESELNSIEKDKKIGGARLRYFFTQYKEYLDNFKKNLHLDYVYDLNDVKVEDGVTLFDNDATHVGVEGQKIYAKFIANLIQKYENTKE